MREREKAPKKDVVKLYIKANRALKEMVERYGFMEASPYTRVGDDYVLLNGTN